MCSFFRLRQAFMLSFNLKTHILFYSSSFVLILVIFRLLCSDLDKLEYLTVHVMSPENDILAVGGSDPEGLGWIEPPPAWLISSSRTSGAAAGGSCRTSLTDGLHSPTKKAPLPPFSASSFSAVVHVCPFLLCFKT